MYIHLFLWPSFPQGFYPHAPRLNYQKLMPPQLFPRTTPKSVPATTITNDQSVFCSWQSVTIVSKGLMLFFLATFNWVTHVLLLISTLLCTIKMLAFILLESFCKAFSLFATTGCRKQVMDSQHINRRDP